MLQAPRQTLGVERVRARQPAGAGRVHRGHAGAAGRVIVSVRRVRGVPIAPRCGRLLHRNHRSAVWRFAQAAAPAIEHHPVQPIAVRAAVTRPPRSQVGLDDLPQHDSVFFSVRGAAAMSAEPGVTRVQPGWNRCTQPRGAAQSICLPFQDGSVLQCPPQVF